MSERDGPSFEEWVEYCFTQAYDDFCSDDDDVHTRIIRFVDLMETQTVGEYMTRLFEAPAFLAERYSDHQIGEAIRFIFGGPSSYFHRFQERTVAAEFVVRCVRAVGTMYTDLFDRVCGARGADPDSQRFDGPGVDGAVYMIWDMDSLLPLVTCEAWHYHLREIGYGILETALLECRTSACRVSALHGIGHWVSRPNKRRLHRIVDEFLATRTYPEWLGIYALQARQGLVQ